MSRWIKLSVIAATATLTVLPLVTPAADAQTIYEKEQDTRHCSIRAEVPWRDTRSICYAES